MSQVRRTPGDQGRSGAGSAQPAARALLLGKAAAQVPDLLREALYPPLQILEPLLGRHLAMVQAPSYNQMLGNVVTQGTVAYTSPNGFKVWAGGPTG